MTWDNWFSLVPALIGAVTALIVKPIFDYWVARVIDTRTYRAHMADRIRDFRESIAVLDSIRLLRARGFPIDGHIEKVAIPSHLVTAEAVDLANLAATDQAEGIQLSNLLENITRDTRSIIASKKAGRAEAYYTQVDELADKMRNLSNRWEAMHPKVGALISRPDTRRKLIMFEDGSKAVGVAYSPVPPSDLPPDEPGVSPTAPPSPAPAP